MRIIKIVAKCSDLFDLKVSGNNDDPCNGIKHEGYVPYGLGLGGGDYIRLQIDADTGQILNWVKLTDEDLLELKNN